MLLASVCCRGQDNIVTVKASTVCAYAVQTEHRCMTAMCKTGHTHTVLRSSNKGTGSRNERLIPSCTDKCDAAQTIKLVLHGQCANGPSCYLVLLQVTLLKGVHCISSKDCVKRCLPLEWFSIARGFCCRCLTTSGGMLLKKRLFSASSVRYSGEALSSELNLQCAASRSQVNAYRAARRFSDAIEDVTAFSLSDSELTIPEVEVSGQAIMQAYVMQTLNIQGSESESSIMQEVIDCN